MDKYIKADDLLNAIYPVDPENDGSDGCTVVARPQTLTSEELEAMIDSLPAADVAPVVHSRWVQDENGTQDHHCIECGMSFRLYAYCKNDYNYCPSCGAKMDLEG